MSQAKVVDTKSTAIALEIGTYHWCSCGFSESNPFSNGSHLKRRVTLLSAMTLIRIFRR